MWGDRQSLETLGSLRSWVWAEGRERLQEEGQLSGPWGHGGTGLQWRGPALTEVPEQRGQGWGRPKRLRLLPRSLSFTFAVARFTRGRADSGKGRLPGP